MKLFKRCFSLVVSSFLLSFIVNAQELKTAEDIYRGKNFYEIQKRANTFFALHPDTTVDGDYRKYKRWEWFWRSRIQKIGDVNGSFNYLTEAALNFATLDPICQTYDPADWNFLGQKNLPTNNMGAVMSLYVDPTNEQFMLVAGRQGGLLRRTNDTLPWENLTDKLRLPYMHVRSVTVEPGTNNQTIYFAAYSGHPLVQKRFNRGIGIFKTTDGGQTWKNIMPIPVMDYPLDCSVIMAPDNPKKLYLLFNNNPDIICTTCPGYYNVYTSLDGGETWTSLGFMGSRPVWEESLEQIYVMPEHPEYLFVAGGAKLWRYSLLNGWVDLTGNLPKYPASNVTDWKRVRVSSKGKTLYVVYLNAQKTTCIDTSSNFGSTFTNLITTGLASDKAKFLIHSKISNRFYVACPQDILFRSKHDLLTGKITGFDAVSTYMNYYNGTYTHCDFRDAYISSDRLGLNDKLILANDGGLLKTVDGCNSYTEISGNLENLNCLSVSTFKNDPNLFRVGAWDNGLYTYRNGEWSFAITDDADISRVKIDELDSRYTYVVVGSGKTFPNRYVENASGEPILAGYYVPWPNKGGIEFKPLKLKDTTIYTAYHDLYKGKTKVIKPGWVNISLNPKELYDVEVQFTPIEVHTGLVTGDEEPYIFDLSQTNNDGTKNGERFYIDLPKKPVSDLVSVKKSESATYHPLIEKNKAWKIESYNDCVNPHYATFIYFTGNDTTINGIIYTKIHGNFIQNDSLCLHTVIELAYLREDTVSRKVFILAPDSTEMLLYDFALKVGDTLRSFINSPYANRGCCMQGAYHMVQSIYNNEVGNKTLKAMFMDEGSGSNTCNDFGANTFITESVGSELGLLECFGMQEYLGTTLQCVTVNGKIVYPDTTGNCVTSVSLLSQKAGDEIQLYPNPTSGTIRIDHPQAIPNSSIIVTDILGKELYRIKATGISNTLDLKGLESGIYLAIFRTDGVNHVQKFVIRR